MAATPGRRRRPRTTRSAGRSRRRTPARSRVVRRASASEPQRLTQAAYARHRQALGLPGATREAVRKAVAEHRIDLLPGGRIDPVAADRAWDERSLPRVDAPGSAAGAHLNTARAERELVRKRLDEYRLAQALRENVPAAEILDAAAECTRLTRERLLNLARRLGPILGHETDATECTRILEQEIEAIAAELARPLELIPGGADVAATLTHAAAPPSPADPTAYPPLPPGAPPPGRIGR